MFTIWNNSDFFSLHFWKSTARSNVYRLHLSMHFDLTYRTNREKNARQWKDSSNIVMITFFHSFFVAFSFSHLNEIIGLWRPYGISSASTMIRKATICWLFEDKIFNLFDLKMSRHRRAVDFLLKYVIKSTLHLECRNQTTPIRWIKLVVGI